MPEGANIGGGSILFVMIMILKGKNLIPVPDVPIGKSRQEHAVRKLILQSAIKSRNLQHVISYPIVSSPENMQGWWQNVF